METENKMKSPVGKVIALVIALVIGIPLLIRFFPIILIGGAAIGETIKESHGAQRVLDKTLPKITEHILANPEAYEEIADGLTAFRLRMENMGIERWAISPPGSIDLLGFRASQAQLIGGAVLEGDDLEMTISYGDGKGKQKLFIKANGGLAPHEEDYMTAEEKGILFKCFDRTEAYELISIEGRKDYWYLLLSSGDVAHGYVNLACLSSEEEKEAFLEYHVARPDHFREIVPGWYAEAYVSPPR